MKRRNFIILGSALGIGITSGSILYSSHNSTDPLSTPEMLLYLFGKNEVALIGKEYLNNFSDVDSMQEISKLLTRDIDMEKLSSDEIRKELNYKIKVDFKNQNTFIIRKILLSQTEAMQCALFLNS